jgi:hypothetical protein
LQQILDQSDRYAIGLADKDEARLALHGFGQIEEVTWHPNWKSNWPI